MALQHFYSRVPARVSMYNKADGFDTFAQSAELQREFVERELAPIYENKLNKIDVQVIRQNKMPCVYTQCTTRSGILLQNCISYLPLDYTGERSAYLSHSLIFSEEEKRFIFSSKEDTAVNPNLFVTSIDSFLITSPAASPNSEYPSLDYIPAQGTESAYLISSLSTETVKSFIYAILNSICGKGRNVCIKLPGENTVLSLQAVQFFNELLSILPVQLCSSISFASYVVDPAQYSNFKLRGVSCEFPDNLAKCVYVDFETNLIAGIQHDEVVANKSLVNFFYSLFENKALRTEFLEYMERATTAIPTLQNLNLKVLSNLVFLFQGGCGLFSEKEILPNDNAIYDYLCAYEKYRAALSEEYRMRSYQCLLRYSQKHQPIPKNIFAKVSRLYPSEPLAAKRIVMNIVLDLIHTDIMRDKLFTFIRSNYNEEDADMKQIIITDLCRVFYGGFLQSQLLMFFSEQFANELENSKSMIIEKLLLSIRTPAVQAKILAFLEQHYDNFSEYHKDRFYLTFLEMLPEHDALADCLVDLVNRFMVNESDTRKASLAQSLIDALETDYRKKDHLLMPLLLKHNGFSSDLITSLAFGAWQNRKIHEDYLHILRGYSLTQKADVLVRIFSLVGKPDYNRLLSEMTLLFQLDSEHTHLSRWLDVYDRLAKLPPKFIDRFNAAVILPSVCLTACDALDCRQYPDAMMRLDNYANGYSTVRDCDQYVLLRHLRDMCDATICADYTEADRHLAYLLKTPAQLPRMAQYMEDVVIDPNVLSPEAVLALRILATILRDGNAGLDKVYRIAQEGITPTDCMLRFITVCSPMSDAGPTLSSLITAADSGLPMVISAFSAAYGKGTLHWLHTHLPQGTSFAVIVEDIVRTQKKASGSFFSNLFRRK